MTVWWRSKPARARPRAGLPAPHASGCCATAYGLQPGAPCFFSRRLCASRVDERLQLLRAARVAELAQRFRLDLPDAFARHFEVLTDLLEGVVALLADAETHAQDLLLARRQRLQDL